MRTVIFLGAGAGNNQPTVSRRAAMRAILNASRGGVSRNRLGRVGGAGSVRRSAVNRAARAAISAAGGF